MSIAIHNTHKNIVIIEENIVKYLYLYLLDGKVYNNYRQ